MILEIKVIPNSSKNSVERQEDGSYRIYTMEKPLKGKANSSVRKLIADFFNISVDLVDIKATTSRKKRVVIKEASI